MSMLKYWKIYLNNLLAAIIMSLKTTVIMFHKKWLKEYLMLIFQNGFLEQPIFSIYYVVAYQKDLFLDNGHYKLYKRIKVTNSKII